MAIDDGSHRAHCEEGPDGKWSGGCVLCGTYFGGAEKLGAESWVSGHDSAVVSASHVAMKVGPRFPKMGPGAALDLEELRYKINDLVAGGLDPVLAEIVPPIDQVPALYLWTPPTEEGWNRKPIGAIWLDRGGQFVPVADRTPVADDSAV